MKLSEYAKKNSITYQTALKHFKNGMIEGAYSLPTGTIVVPDLKSNPKKELTFAIYARVSSSQNKSNLDSQVDRLSSYCMARGHKISKVVKEIGSGLNDKRPKFRSLLTDSSIDVIVIEHKDRATRFGFNYLEDLLAMSGRKIEVVNLSEGDKDDLMQDLISIIRSFMAKYYGQRRSKRKTEKIIEALQSDG